MVFKHVRCNPDVAPHPTSGGYETKVAGIITPINMLFIGGGEFSCDDDHDVMMMMMMMMMTMMMMMMMTIISVEQRPGWGEHV